MNVQVRWTRALDQISQSEKEELLALWTAVFGETDFSSRVDKVH
jgi:hypothetical protein